MSYTLKERAAIGEQIYKEQNGIPIPRVIRPASLSEMQTVSSKPSGIPEMDEYMAMSKEELIRELILAKANELRTKKGYEVKGAGANKEFIPLNNKKCFRTATVHSKRHDSILPARFKMECVEQNESL